VPLGFKDEAQFNWFKTEVRDTLTGLKTSDGRPVTAIVKQVGSATSFYSRNPDKPLGYHWDSKGIGMRDLDFEVRSPELADHMLGVETAAANPKMVIAGEHTIFKNNAPEEGGFFQQCPELASLAQRYSDELGREVDFKLRLDRTPVSEIPKQNYFVLFRIE
jgi:hypothetical protein